jgi:phosphohistidine phosphatase
VDAARKIGTVLAKSDQVPDRIISSTAVRARTTAVLAAEAGKWGVVPSLEPRFYGTGAEVVLEVVRGVEGAEKLLIVGHQPTWGLLVHALTGEYVEMKTATVAIIECPVDRWSDLEEGDLVALLHPSR